MSFEKLISKVTQAEHALEAQERHVAADFRQFKASFKQLWTPGRLITVGLVSGFVLGRVRTGKLFSSATMQMLSTVSTLIAGSSAQSAAKQAEKVEEAVQGDEAVARSAINRNRNTAAAAPVESAGAVPHSDRNRPDPVWTTQPPAAAEAATEVSEH